MGAIIAVIVAADQRIIARLRADGAISPDRAVPRSELERVEQGRVKAMLGSGVLQQTRDGRIYLDETRLANGRNRARSMVGVIAAVAVLAFLIVLLIGVFR